MKTNKQKIEASVEAIAAAHQAGYDEFVELWVRYGCCPSPMDCTARLMPEGPLREAHLSGWKKAREET